MTNGKQTGSGGQARPIPDATLEFLDSIDSVGMSACAVLTPNIKANLLALQPGQVLLVRTDDPSARLDVPAWCNLTGNILQAVAQGENDIVEFFIRKESKR
ncbi:MAG: sulfurtransferase TusA family protein [Chloroflexota bacterium]